MIKKGYYYPSLVWEHKLHKNEETGEYLGDCAFCFIEGNRRAGKSVGVGIYALMDFFKYGYKTVLIRRYDKDFNDKKKQAMENFWSKAWGICLQYGYIKDLSEHELTFDGHTAYIDGVILSYPIALNLYNDAKNNFYDNVHTIIYDEYVSEQGSRLPDEVFAMYNIYDTIARSRADALQTTSVIFISNVISNANCFHADLGIDRELRKDTKKLIRADKGYMVEIVNNKTAADEMKTSTIAKVMQNSESGRRYLGYSQDNEVKDDESFVKPKMSGRNYYSANFIFEKKLYGMIYYIDEGVFYFTDNNVDKDFPETYAVTREDHTINSILITRVLKPKMKNYMNYYAAGLLYFNSMRSKAVFMEMARYM